MEAIQTTTCPPDISLPKDARHETAWYWESAAAIYQAMKNGYWHPPDGHNRFKIRVLDRSEENYGGAVVLEEIAYRIGFGYGSRGTDGYWHPGPDDDNPPEVQQQKYPDWLASQEFRDFAEGKEEVEKKKEVSGPELLKKIEGIINESLDDIGKRITMAREGLAAPIPVNAWISALPKWIAALSALKGELPSANFGNTGGVNFTFIRQHIDMLQDPVSKQRNAQILANYVNSIIPQEIIERAFAQNRKENGAPQEVKQLTTGEGN